MQSSCLRLNPYPFCHRFAFTIIHDADSAYSKRLQPLINEFNNLKIPITVTVFTLWAAWAKNGAIWREWSALDARNRYTAPVAVPLEDNDELSFYRALAEQGHEIAMHTPSETSDTRKRVTYAFEYFQRALGSHPRMYVEHSAGNKLDAQVNLGSASGSVYYNTDLLNDSGCWIWLDYEGSISGSRGNCYDVLAAFGSPFDQAAEQRFGVRKGFLRSGQSAQHDGNGFVQCYSHRNIDALVANRGVALVYTHLNNGWLNLRTRTMRESIKQRLSYLRSKNGWFTTGSNILDRFHAIAFINLAKSDSGLTLTNSGETNLDSVSLIVDKPNRVLRIHNKLLVPDEDGLALIGDIKAKESLNIVVE